MTLRRHQVEVNLAVVFVETEDIAKTALEEVDIDFALYADTDGTTCIRFKREDSYGRLMSFQIIFMTTRVSQDWSHLAQYRESLETMKNLFREVPFIDIVENF